MTGFPRALPHALALVAALVIGVLLSRGCLPQPGDSSGRYAARLLAAGQQLSEDLYVQLLLLVPGGASATLTSTSSGLDVAAGLGVAGGQGRKESLAELTKRADVLKQGLAQSEVEIDAQQKVSTKRYAEARREREEAAQVALEQPDEVISMPPEQPDEVRLNMPPVARDGPEMRCGKAIPSESRLVTRDIELHARAIFQGAHGRQFSWKYIITFSNRGQETVQMLTRHWVMVDALGRLETEVKGPGARGVTPVLPPGGEWVYESGTSLQTPHGSMHGSFQFEVLKGDTSPSRRSFSARVGRLALSKGGESLDVPCIDEAKEGLLPTTSVLSIERVIVGGTSSFMRKKDGRYYFSYDVQINNARDLDIEVIGHHWEVIDSKGQRHVVAEGVGVGGKYRGKPRLLTAGDAFRTQGEVSSPTPQANAQGTFRIKLLGEGGDTEIVIEARTDFMGLSSSKDATHVPNFIADPSFR